MLLEWCRGKLRPILPYLPVTDLDSCWRDGVLLCGLVHLCAPQLVDMNAVKLNTDAANVNLAISVIFNEFGIQTITSGDVLPPSGPDLLAIISTILELKKVYESIHREPISAGVAVGSLSKKAKTQSKSPEKSKAISPDIKKNKPLSPDNKKSVTASPSHKKSVTISLSNKKSKPLSHDNNTTSQDDKKSKTISPEKEKSKESIISRPQTSESKAEKSQTSDNKKTKLHPPTSSETEESKKVKLSSPKIETNPFAEPEPPCVSPPKSVFKKALPSANKKTKVQNEDVNTSSSDLIASRTRKASKNIDDDEILFHTPEPSATSVAPVGPTEAIKKRVTSQRKLRKKTESKFIAEIENIETVAHSKVSTTAKGSQKCHTCSQSVLVLKRVAVEGYAFHRKCFVCEDCSVVLKTSTYHLITSNDPNLPGHFYCKKHFNEVIARSRELKGSTSIGQVQITRNKESKKKVPRSASVCLHEKDYRKEYNPTVPSLMEDISESKELSPPPRNRSKTTPIPETPPPVEPSGFVSKSKSPNKITDSLDTQKSTKDRSTTSSPNQKAQSPTSLTKVTITDVPSPGRVQTRTPSTRGERISSNVVRKKYDSTSPMEELPTEGIPDNRARIGPPKQPTPPPPIDMLPPLVSPIKKKSSKTYRAPKPPQKSDDNLTANVPISKSMDVVSGNLGDSPAVSTPAMVSKKAISITPVDKEKPADEEQKDSVKTISEGVKKVDPAGKTFKNQRIKPRLNPIIAEEFAKFHSHSMSDLDSYISNHSKKMRTEFEKDKSEETVMTVQDRIALYTANDKKAPVQLANKQEVDQKEVEPDSDRKKIEVSADLKKVVSREKDRVATSRPPTATQRKMAKRRLLMPSNKHTQKRLEQAQKIQRDRSLLEQKLVEFENEAAEVEQQLRNTGKDDVLLSQFLELVNIKNELTRRENEVHLCEKYLQLLDEQDQIERDLR